MAKLKVIIEITVKADATDDEAIREAVYDRLTGDMEAEELEFRIDEDEIDEEEESD
jgi:hypothetical protein